jgi:hypothetical protein
MTLHLYFIFKYMQTYFEALNSHFQPNHHVKIFKNLGSGHHPLQDVHTKA